jgi:enoyl-CoA hydratase/carnithine racemase
MEPRLTRHDDVIVLDLGDGENRFNPASISRLAEAVDEIDEIAAAGDKVGLVTTGSGKFFSNGIDLDWMLGETARQDPETVTNSLAAMLDVWARVMSLPIPTVAAVNGHAFAGGAMFALAHDHVLMRADRGFWCVNEVLLQLPLAPGMQAILQARLPAPTTRRAILTAHRFNGPDAVAGSIADEIHDADNLRPRAIELARSLAPTAAPVLGRLKEDLYAGTLATLREGAVPSL